MIITVIYLQLASLSYVLALPAIGAIIEDVNSAVLVRDKRDPSRALTFSGFMPGTGMSAFASSADFTPYYRPRRPSHHPSASWGAEEGRGEFPAEPSTVEHPPERNGSEKPWTQPEGKKPEEEEDEEEEIRPVRPVKKNKKKYSPKDNEEDEEEEESDKPSRGGGNAAASFNAWFPIMLGMFPSGGYPSQGQGQEGEGGFARGGGSQGSRYNPSGHTTVIANSVSHGRSGVASSHAVAYGGGSPPPHRR